MTDAYWTYVRSVESVPCPTCHAKPGDRCTKQRNNVRPYHLTRARRAIDSGAAALQGSDSTTTGATA